MSNNGEKQQVRIIEGWTRDIGLPEDLPEDAEIYNAARPFPCHRDWTGEFVHGVFYGAIYPGADYADQYRERAKALDAHHVVFVPRDEVEIWGHGYCTKHEVIYDDFEFDEIARAYLRHSAEEAQ